MKKTSLIIAALIALTGAAQAYEESQNFNTGAISPGTPTVNTFNVAKFDTRGGMRTLTGVTITISLETWGGSFSIQNTTTDNSPVIGTFWQGVSADISGARVPTESWVSDTLNARQLLAFNLPNNSSTESLVGPASNDRNSATPITMTALEENYDLYQGRGTYAIKFNSSQSSWYSADGSVSYNGTAAFSQGYMTVKYDYVPEYVPEPTSAALLAMGCAVICMRRRGRRAPKA
jgi:hypothetical protein